MIIGQTKKLKKLKDSLSTGRSKLDDQLKQRLTIETVLSASYRILLNMVRPVLIERQSERELVE